VRLLPCPRCRGTRYEPSAATLSRDPCHACGGLGWLAVYFS